ncbi:hypothetical protein ACFL5Y_03645 [Candidatus Omnitrophota bacterium]
MRIAIDIDGVICDMVAGVMPTIRRDFKSNFKKKDIYKHEINEALGVPEKAFNHTFKEAYKKGEALSAIREAPKYIEKLYKKHKITLITARPEKMNSITRNWLRLKRIKYHRLINIKRKKHLKLDTYDVFIDDHLSEIIWASKIKDLRLILFDQPWNKSYNVKKLFTRVQSWKEIHTIINEYEKRN